MTPKKTPSKTVKKPAKAAPKSTPKIAPKKAPIKKEAKPAAPETEKILAETLAQAAYDTKAEGIVVLDVRKLSGFADYFLICSGSSDRQVQAIADRIEASAKEKLKARPMSVEGFQTGHWILLDFGSVIAHVFYQEARDFYSLDKLWGDAPSLKLKLK